ncbi:NapC/NirT family cytochrome c [Maridesulfovibrio sp.]|uniref:cytochrome c3 family protein n=1 Tax=Maridesulfovibrio sp. TaxID=2795000 RepID=UPI0029F4D4B3|nr:NapC/NirT family cytochrome c [Maridesulfovibrio sp.]
MPVNPKKTGEVGFSRRWRWGVVSGFLIAVVMVLTSGYMVNVTNTDVFCQTCHAMKPFRAAWQNSVHGGQNPQGFAAQCVDCHLPHGNFVEYMTTKAYTGTRDIIMNLVIDPAEYDWAANAEKNRLKFTYDNACRHCHIKLEPVGVKPGALLAHRAYLYGQTDKKCASCHPHVGHKDMIEMANKFFTKDL